MSKEALTRHYLECGSTNDLARAWVSDPDGSAPHGARVTADFQTQGRGRRGRTWDAAPRQNVLLSVVLRPAFPPADAWQLGFLAALAVADVLTASGLTPRLKWPNDVLLNDHKVAGILVETLPSLPGGAGWAAVAGIGLNVNQAEFPVPELLLHPATSLRIVTGREWEVPAIARAVADTLEQRVAEHEREGWGGCWDAYRRRLAVGAGLKRVEGDQEERGTLIDVEADGNARVRLADGTFVRWASVEEERAGNPS